MNIKKIIKSREARNTLVCMLRFLPDEAYLKLMYRIKTGRKLNLENPVTFNEKLQWLKLHDRKPIYTIMVDKYEAKKYVADTIGEQYIIPTLGVWEHYDDIDFDSLPDQFVLKCTHDSGGLVIVKDKSKLDHKAAKQKIEKSLKTNFFWVGREWPYKNVQPRIIAEKYLEAFSANIGTEYKIFCFNGNPTLVLVCKGEGHGTNRTNDFYDMDFNHLPVTGSNPNAKNMIEKPAQFADMIRLAKLLSQNIMQLRIDFYVVDNQIFFGETTFYHDSGMRNFNPEYWDEKFGQLLQIN